MKKAIKSIIIAILLVLFLYPSSHTSHAEQWKQVVNKGFGNTNNDYAWSMATFQKKLYVGTLNGLNGAQIWCSNNGEPGTWRRVYRAIPFSNSGIRCLYADGDRALYACTFNSFGGQILRTTDGRIWTTVGRSGLGDTRNTSIRCMARFGDYLYAGTGSSDLLAALDVRGDGQRGGNIFHQPYGAELYRSKNGFVWELVRSEPDFRSTEVFDSKKNAWVTNNVTIGELEVFGNMLYAFTWSKDVTIQSGSFIQNMAEVMIQGEAGELSNYPDSAGAFELWRTADGQSWEKIVGVDDPYGNGMGFSMKDPDPDSMKNDVVTSVAVFQGKLYLGTENNTGKTAVWRTAEGTRWERVLNFSEKNEKFNFYVWRMISFRDSLFVGTMNMGYIGTPGVTGGQIWVSDSGDSGSFRCLVHNGFDGETIPLGNGKRMPKNYGIRVFGILKDTLFAGTATVLSLPITGSGRQWPTGIAGKDVGCEVWKLVPVKESSQLSVISYQLSVKTVVSSQ